MKKQTEMTKAAITEWCRQKGYPAAPLHVDELVREIEHIQTVNTPYHRAAAAVQSKIAVVGEQRSRFSRIKRIFTGPKNRKKE